MDFNQASRLCRCMKEKLSSTHRNAHALHYTHTCAVHYYSLARSYYTNYHSMVISKQTAHILSIQGMQPNIQYDTSGTYRWLHRQQITWDEGFCHTIQDRCNWEFNLAYSHSLHLFWALKVLTILGITNYHASSLYNNPSSTGLYESRTLSCWDDWSTSCQPQKVNTTCFYASSLHWFLYSHHSVSFKWGSNTELLHLHTLCSHL